MLLLLYNGLYYRVRFFSVLLSCDFLYNAVLLFILVFDFFIGVIMVMIIILDVIIDGED